MRKPLLCAIIAVLIAAAPAFSLQDKWYNDFDPNATGGITGKVLNGELKECIALEQIAYKVYRGSANGNTYSFNRLPPGKYDVLLKLTEDAIEGVRLDVFGEAVKLPKQDHDAIWELIRISDDYFHDKKIIRVGGTADLQKLVVEQIRTATTYNPDGTIAVGKMFRRIDYTIVHKTREVWQIDPDSPRFMFREEREKVGAGSTIKFHFDDKLGGIRVADLMVAVPDIDLNKTPIVKPAAEGSIDPFHKKPSKKK